MFCCFFSEEIDEVEYKGVAFQAGRFTPNYKLHIEGVVISSSETLEIF